MALETVWQDAVDSLDGLHSPAVTVWQSANMAIACYRYARPDLGMRLLRRAAFNPVKLEKMLGTFTTINPHPSMPARKDNKLMYNWGAGPFLEAIVVGLLGLEVDAFANTIRFNPQIPEHWTTVKLTSFRVGDQEFDFIYQKPFWKIDFRHGYRPFQLWFSQENAPVELEPLSSITI